MKIADIIEDFDRLSSDLSKFMSLLGSGTYAKVYEKRKSGMALKLCSTRDTGYRAFAGRCMEMGNPHLPKIDSIIDGPGESTAFLVILEKLSSYEGTALCDDMELHNVLYVIAEQCMEDRQNAVNFFTKWGSPTPAWIANMADSKIGYVLDRPKLFEALLIVADMVSDGPDWDLDMHAGNFMMRGNTIVITDPIQS